MRYLTAMMRGVCPTYVGMNRAGIPCGTSPRSMPHVCGDEPDDVRGLKAEAQVCPTYVGMNRGSLLHRETVFGMPHVGGDEPGTGLRRSELQEYAPRMWG